MTAESFLLKWSRITFFDNRQFPEESKLPGKFSENFENSPLHNKFDKFCINSPDSSMNFEDLEDFIESFGSNIKEFTIFRLNIRSVLYALRQKDLINLIPFNLTKLDVVCEDVNTQLIIPMDRLKHIKTLRLGEGILKIVNDCMVAPVELQLKNTCFLEGRKNYQKCVRINSLFDFRNLQILRLDCCDTANVELDMDGVVSLQSLILENVKIINWKTSKWIVKKLTLGKKMKFVAATGMKFDELDYSGPEVDLAFLPKTLKNFTVRKLKTKILNIEFAQNLVDLQSIILCRREFSVLAYFNNCPKLTHLHLIPIVGDDDDLTPIDVNLIPKSLIVFRLSNDCDLCGVADFQIENLIIENMSFLKALHIATTPLKIENAFLYCSDFEFVTKGCVAKEFMADMFQEYIVGPFLQTRGARFDFDFCHENSKAECLFKSGESELESIKKVGKFELDDTLNSWWNRNI